MALPLMTEVFLVEASMNAWQLLGFSPGAKAAFEAELGRDAFEIAVYRLPSIVRGARMGGIDARAGELEARKWLGHDVSRDQIASARQGFVNPKFLQSVRSAAPEVVRLVKREQFGPAYELLQDLHAKFPPPDPEGYQGRVVLDLGGGWKWVSIDCGVADHEGTLMQHCGFSMGDMYSLRDPSGKPHVTIEVVDLPEGVDSGPIHYDQGISQIKGKQNKPPVKKFWPAIRAFVDSLPSGSRKIQEWEEEWRDLLDYLGQPLPDDKVSS